MDDDCVNDYVIMILWDMSYSHTIQNCAKHRNASLMPWFMDHDSWSMNGRPS